MYSLIAMVSNLENLLTLILPKETQKEICVSGTSQFCFLIALCSVTLLSFTILCIYISYIIFQIIYF